MASEQLSLFGRSDMVSVDFTTVRRIQCDEHSWIDYGSSFLSGHASLFELLRRRLPLKAESRVMYERTVDVPRLVCSLPEDAEVPAALAEVQTRLAQHYGVPGGFARIGVALYRDGSDSVAWHRDHLPRDRPTLVAILSLGRPRRVLVRRHDKAGDRAVRGFQLGWGDLFVMGGMCQADWEHCIPKQAQAGPRMSCVFRHVYD